MSLVHSFIKHLFKYAKILNTKTAEVLLLDQLLLHDWMIVEFTR